MFTRCDIQCFFFQSELVGKILKWWWKVATLFFSVAQQPNSDLGRLTVKVSRSRVVRHTTDGHLRRRWIRTRNPSKWAAADLQLDRAAASIGDSSKCARDLSGYSSPSEPQSDKPWKVSYVNFSWFVVCCQNHFCWKLSLSFLMPSINSDENVRKYSNPTHVKIPSLTHTKI